MKACSLFTFQGLMGLAAACPSQACAALAEALPGDVALPGTPAYAASNTYWSNKQSEAQPACFLTPRNTDGVSTALTLLTHYRAPFSVKGGGHAAFRGASNSDGGVTIDLLYLDYVELSPDRKTLSAGAGSRWIDISEKLDPLGLAAVGGRTADVGVAGLILGGGISYFSGRYGWACDNILAFEVVLASGDVVTATPDRGTDLYWALRGGGGSSFGIVTRFELAMIEQGKLWAHNAVYPLAATESLIPLFTDLAIKGLPADPDAHTYFAMSSRPELGGSLVLTTFYHAVAPPSPDDTPAVFVPFESVPGALYRVSNISSITDNSRAIDEPYGHRQTWWDVTVRITSPEFFQRIVPLFEAHASRLAAVSTPDSPALPYVLFQPISTNIIEEMQKNGGNALRLDPADGPLMIVQISATWDDGSLDDVMEESCRETARGVEELAREMEVEMGPVYMNYAGREQDVLASYGEESLRRLRRVAERYDPDGVLPELWRGYFQVGR